MPPFLPAGIEDVVGEVVHFEDAVVGLWPAAEAAPDDEEPEDDEVEDVDEEEREVHVHAEEVDGAHREPTSPSRLLASSISFRIRSSFAFCQASTNWMRDMAPTDGMRRSASRTAALSHGRARLSGPPYPTRAKWRTLITFIASARSRRLVRPIIASASLV